MYFIVIHIKKDVKKKKIVEKMYFILIFLKLGSVGSVLQKFKLPSPKPPKSTL